MHLRFRAQAHRQAGGAHAVAHQDIHAMLMVPAGQIAAAVNAGGFNGVAHESDLPAVIAAWRLRPPFFMPIPPRQCMTRQGKNMPAGAFSALVEAGKTCYTERV